MTPFPRITIRPALDEDYADIVRLRQETIRHINARDYPEEVIENWAAKVSVHNLRETADKFKRWVALDKKRVIGFCEHNSQCEVSRIYIHKHYLRNGVGSRLLEVAEASLEGDGCSEVKVDSTITARGFYAKRGYKLLRKTFHNGNEKEPVYEMLKKLP